MLSSRKRLCQSAKTSRQALCLWPAALFCFAFFLLLSPQAHSGVSMDTGGKVLQLDPPAEDKAGDAEAMRDETGMSTIDDLPARPADNAGGDALEPLPWGITPEVHVPWLPGGGARPPHKPEGKPPYPRPGAGSIRPPSLHPGGAWHGGHMRQTEDFKRDKGVRAQPDKKSSVAPHKNGNLRLGAYGPGGTPVVGGSGLGPRPAGAPPVSSGVSGRPPTAPPANPSGFSDKAPTGAPQRQLYPGMRPPLPGNVPQPVYPGEKPFAPGMNAPGS